MSMTSLIVFEDLGVTFFLLGLSLEAGEHSPFFETAPGGAEMSHVGGGPGR